MVFALLVVIVSVATSALAEGVLILKVDSLSPLAAQLGPGDRIMEVSQQSVSKPVDVERLFEAARRNGEDQVLLLVSAMFGLQFMAVSSQSLKGVKFLDETKKRPAK